MSPSHARGTLCRTLHCTSRVSVPGARRLSADPTAAPGPQPRAGHCPGINPRFMINRRLTSEAWRPLSSWRGGLCKESRHPTERGNAFKANAWTSFSEVVPLLLLRVPDAPQGQPDAAGSVSARRGGQVQSCCFPGGERGCQRGKSLCSSSPYMARGRPELASHCPVPPLFPRSPLSPGPSLRGCDLCHQTCHPLFKLLVTPLSSGQNPDSSEQPTGVYTTGFFLPSCACLQPHPCTALSQPPPVHRLCTSLPRWNPPVYSWGWEFPLKFPCRR